MKSPNNIASTLFRASNLAFIIFWVQIAITNIQTITFIGPFIILSYLLIYIVCTITIFVTILILYYLVRNKLSNREIFKKFFPYSAILIFCFCACFVIGSKFDTNTCIFFITVFFTLMQSWIWICSPNKTKKLS